MDLSECSEIPPDPGGGPVRRDGARAHPWWCVLVTVIALLATVPSAAQDPDTTNASPVETPQRVPVGFTGAPWGPALTDSIPAVRPYLRFVDLLAAAPGSFTYRFDRAGWPDGWSPFGRSPNTIALDFNGVPFTHLFTGRPGYEFIPSTLIEPPHLVGARFGSPYVIATRQRSFASPIPVTEGTYWRGGDGLQSIDAVHAQHRTTELLGRPGFLNLMGAYSGRATNVAYPGSDLTRGRRVQLRLRFEQRDWSAEVLNIHNRRRIGAHAGVIPQPGNPASIYRVDLAEVENPEAERRIIRNDFMVTLRSRLFPRHTTSVTTYWSSESFRFRDRSDTLHTASDRLGLHLQQPLAATQVHELAVHVEGWVDRVEPGGGFAAATQRQKRLHLFIRDTLRGNEWSGIAEAGWAFGGRHGGPTAHLSASRQIGAVGWRAEMTSSIPTSSMVYSTGFGTLTGRSDVGAGRSTVARMETVVRRGDVSLRLGLFGDRDEAPVDVYADGMGADVEQASAPFHRAGTYADVGWRRDAARGFYAVLRPTVTRFLNTGASPLHRRAANALPQWHGSARMGARYTLFQRDLDFDIYLENVVWSSSSSRQLHPETGLLLIPESSAAGVSASNTLDLVAEIRVRDAKLFLVYDNVLAGTSFLPGNFLVPVYPLPAQRFRFGIYWPILG